MGRIIGELYQVWLSRGRGLEPGPRFASLRDAIAYSVTNASLGAFGIRRPNGEWYRWPDSGDVMRRIDAS